MKPPKFKRDDIFRIVNPIIVDRVGYPLTPAMVLKELNTSENRQRIIDMLQDFDVPVHQKSFDVFSNNLLPEHIESVLKVISYYTVRVRGFGGCERTLHTTEHPKLKDQQFTVQEKKTVRTGTRVSGYGHGEDYEPAFLSKSKSHTLLRFWDAQDTFNLKDMWIETCNVELVT